MTSPELEESASLLCKLGESPINLASQFLELNKGRLEKDLDELSSYNVSGENNGEIVLMFIERCCNTALNNVALTIATYNNIFPSADNEYADFKLVFKIECVYHYLFSINRRMISMATDVVDRLCPIGEFLNSTFTLSILYIIDVYIIIYNYS